MNESEAPRLEYIYTEGAHRAQLVHWKDGVKTVYSGGAANSPEQATLYLCLWLLEQEA